MSETRLYERASVAATGTTAVELVPAPPAGVSYRVVFVNAHNNTGNLCVLSGHVRDSTNSKSYGALYTSALGGGTFIKQISSFSMGEYPTVAVLDNTDESFRIETSRADSTFIVTACYEVGGDVGSRTFRNAFATTNGTTPVELIPAPAADEVYKVVSVNAENTEAATRTMWLNVGTGSGASLERVGQMSADANTMFIRCLGSLFEPPSPEIVLSSTSDSLEVELNDTGAINVIANYEVHRKAIA